MNRFGPTLESFLVDHKLNAEQINQVGIQLLNTFQKLHSIGYVYNDLKPDNICLGNYGEEAPGLLKLIDFGLCTPFLSS